MKNIGALIALSLLSVSANAAIIQFDLVGVAGPGLLPGNEPGSITGGTGGEIGAGISYDDVLNQLTVNVGWGSGNGFTDLTSAVNNSHVHGPTVAINGSGFTQTAGVFANLTRTSNSQVNGAIVNQVVTFATAQNELDLLNGKFYINVHTATNGGGELRGFLTVVPVPASVWLFGSALGLLGWAKRTIKLNSAL